jgi:putative intracellular protease/amidase
MTERLVYLFVFDSMVDWESAFAVAGINNPDFQRRPGRYRLVTVGTSKEPVTTMGGLHILPEAELREVELSRSAMLILPGGTCWERGGNREAIEMARKFFIAGVPIAAICGATLALARAGMLDDFHHTSNSPEYLTATGYRGGGFYCKVPAITDEGMITASGFAPIEFAREIFRVLDLYSFTALQTWYANFKYGSVTTYSDLANARCA